MKKYFLILLLVTLPLQTVYAGSDSGQLEKIKWIQDRLDEAAAPSRTWQYGWATAYGAMAYLYTAQAVTLDDDDEKNDRVDAKVNAVISLLGVGSFIVDPLTTYQAGEKLRAFPLTTEEERQTALDEGENLLYKCAMREKRGRGWLSHSLAALVSVGAGVAVACDDDRTEDGAVMFASSLLITEIQIFTQPTYALRAWKAYQENGWTQAQNIRQARPKFFVSPIYQGLALNYRF